MIRLKVIKIMFQIGIYQNIYLNKKAIIMKKLIILLLLVSSIVVSQEAPVNRQNTNNSNNSKAYLELDKGAIDEIQSQKNLNNDKFADKYHYQNQNSSFICESNNNRRVFCPADTRYGVEFLRQLSRSSCDYNWGYDERGVWVDNGCRAEFSANQAWDNSAGDGNIFVCESNRYERNYCRVYLQARDVMLYRQLSNSSCQNNWGYDQGGIWVTNGCRAEFVIEDRFDPRNELVVCSSMNGQFRMCRADTRGGVEFVRQLSRSSCNYNWGYNQQGIWVTNGCRAQFRLMDFHYDDFGNDYNQPRNVNCSSTDLRQRNCAIGPHNGVRLIKQRSRASCQGNWGFNQDSIWVTNGCRATFEVLPYRPYNNGHGNNNGFGNNGHGNNHGHGNNNGQGNNNGFGNPNYSKLICESIDMRRKSCSIPPRSKVKLIRQLSNKTCRSNWGYDLRNIWVTNGCRAEFEVKSE
jgi:hypothetical protein